MTAAVAGCLQGQQLIICFWGLLSVQDAANSGGSLHQLLGWREAAESIWAGIHRESGGDSIIWTSSVVGTRDRLETLGSTNTAEEKWNTPSQANEPKYHNEAQSRFLGAYELQQNKHRGFSLVRCF